MNRRVHRTVIGVQTWLYAWDGWQEAQELVWNGTNVVPERQFVWGEQLDELVAYRYRQPGQGAFSEFFIAEGGAHCPSRVLDAQGTVVEVQEYDPYGKASFFDGSGNPVGGGTQFTVGNPFQWKGHRVDPETGLTYMRNRYYNSTWGRFLAGDPIGSWGDSVSLGNGYAYAANAPLCRADRFGLQSEFHDIMRGIVEGILEQHGQGVYDVNISFGTPINPGAGLPNITGATVYVGEAGFWYKPVFDSDVLNAALKGAWDGTKMALEEALGNVLGGKLLQLFRKIGGRAFDSLYRRFGREALARANTKLGADRLRRLADILDEKVCPNHRQAKAWANDGRQETWGGRAYKSAQLPKRGRGGRPITYIEHDVNAKLPLGPRDGERFVIGSDGGVWYTSDHYQTFEYVGNHLGG